MNLDELAMHKCHEIFKKAVSDSRGKCNTFRLRIFWAWVLAVKAAIKALRFASNLDVVPG